MQWFSQLPETYVLKQLCQSFFLVSEVKINRNYTDSPKNNQDQVHHIQNEEQKPQEIFLLIQKLDDFKLQLSKLDGEWLISGSEEFGISFWLIHKAPQKLFE